MTRITWNRVAGVAAALTAAALIAGCGSNAASPAASDHPTAAAAASSARAFATSSAGQEAKKDAAALAAACSPKGPDGKPVADPMATLLGSSDARHVFTDCEKIPRHDWPKAISCLFKWGSKAHKALANIPGYTSQLRDVFAEQVLNYCAAYAKGTKPAPKEPVFS